MNRGPREGGRPAAADARIADGALGSSPRTVTVRGDLDLARAAQLEEELLAAARTGTDLVLDLCGVAFADSTAVRLCARLVGELAAQDRSLQVRASGPPAAALRLAGLGRLLGGPHAPLVVDTDPEPPPRTVGPTDEPGPTAPPDHELHFLALRSSPAVARGAATRWLARHRLDLPIDDVLLVVSELVTNVVLHTGGPGCLGLDIDATVTVRVHDGSPQLPARLASAGSHGGYGLRLVDRIAHRWGCVPEPDGKVLWVDIVGAGRTDSDPHGRARRP